jgi:voltage-gated potassium channel
MCVYNPCPVMDILLVGQTFLSVLPGTGHAKVGQIIDCPTCVLIGEHLPSKLTAAVYRQRFTILLVTSLCTLLIAPVILDAVGRRAPEFEPVFHFMVSFLLLLAALLSVSGKRGMLFVGIGLLLSIALFDVRALLIWPGHLEELRFGMRAVFIGFVIIVILRHLFRARQVTFDTINASLCVYLLLGSLWAYVFPMIESAAPGSFLDSSHPAEAAGGVPYPGYNNLRMLYFSFATLSTTGYGDIVPQSMVARMCAVTEAMIGQGYLLVMVSRLVAIQVAQIPPRASTEE